MRNYFIFGNYDSRDFGVYISGEGTYNAPARVYNAVSVPGRNGDLLIYEGKFENIELTYPAFIAGDGFAEKLADFRSALLSVNGYQRLIDSYHPDEYRRAYFGNQIIVKARKQNDAGNFDIVFTCDPRRFLLSGETAVVITALTTISNPTLFPSVPLIRISGTGTVGVGGTSITVAEGYPYVDIDSETQNCHYGTQNANALVTFSNHKFPELQPGSNVVSLTSGITSVRITPRWYRL